MQTYAVRSGRASGSDEEHENNDEIDDIDDDDDDDDEDGDCINDRSYAGLGRKIRHSHPESERSTAADGAEDGNNEHDLPHAVVFEQLDRQVPKGVN